MSKQQALDLLMLLSALESWSFTGGARLPDYLYDRIEEAVAVLRTEILK